MKAIDLLNSANKAYNIDFKKNREASMKEFDNRKYGKIQMGGKVPVKNLMFATPDNKKLVKVVHLHEWKKMKRTDAKYCKECGIIRSESFIKSHNKE